MTYQNIKSIKKGSARNVILIFFSILLVIGAFVIAEYRNKNKQVLYVADETVALGVENIEAQNLDTDSDGLKDWEEILLGSNPKDPKSKAEVSKSKTETDLTVKKESLTSTDILSRDFFARYMELRKMGISNDKQSQEDAMSQSISSVMAQSQPKIYTVANIVTNDNMSKDSIRNYGNKIGEVFKKYSLKSRNEAIIAKEALDKEDPKILNELDPIIANYKKTLSEILKVSVPSSISQLHLDLINSLSGIIFVDELFRKTNIDALAGLQAAGSYIKYAEAFTTAYTGIRSYFSFLGITYEANEGGSIFQI